MNQGPIQMMPADMLMLRWLRTKAINDLQCEEYDMIMDFANRYLNGETPSFTEVDLITLRQIYERVRYRGE